MNGTEMKLFCCFLTPATPQIDFFHCKILREFNGLEQNKEMH